MSNVQAVFNACIAGREPAPGVITKVVQGVGPAVLLLQAPLQEHEADIKSMLYQLEPNFQHQLGGGLTFLRMCYTKHGNQWTGQHMYMDMLVCLGLGAELVQLTPAAMNVALPGGMPYVVVL